MSRVGELDPDIMDCGEPEATWKEMVKHLRWRAGNSRGLAFEAEQTAKDATESAEMFAAQADDFDALAAALERANVTFPASGMEAPSGGETVQQGSTEGDSPTVEDGDAQ